MITTVVREKTAEENSLWADRALALRLEQAEGSANARFVEARARLDPNSGAQWIEVAGAFAMFDGVRSPCTQTFGLGMVRLPSPSEMDTIELFFKQRGAPVMHEVCPCADKGLVEILAERRYRAIEFSNVMYLALKSGRELPSTVNDRVQVRIAGKHEHDFWARTAAEGWREFTQIADLMRDLMRVSTEREDGVSFIAQWDGHAIAAGALSVHDGVALLAGASTIPEWRRRGAQRALLAARLQHALNAGCDVAMMCAEPGSISQRNAERHGFRIAYTRTKFALPG